MRFLWFVFIPKWLIKASGRIAIFFVFLGTFNLLAKSRLSYHLFITEVLCGNMLWTYRFCKYEKLKNAFWWTSVSRTLWRFIFYSWNFQYLFFWNLGTLKNLICWNLEAFKIFRSETLERLIFYFSKLETVFLNLWIFEIWYLLFVVQIKGLYAVFRKTEKNSMGHLKEI